MNKYKKHITTKSNKWLYIIIIIVLTFILYGNTINHGYVLDDDFVTRANEFVQKGFSGIKDIISNGYFKGFNNNNEQLYRPLVLINFAIEKEFFGNNPHVNHFFNILFYAITNILLFLLLSKLFKNKIILIPFLITLLFIAHPIHTEVVANIKSRDEILVFLFSILTLNFLLDYVDKHKTKFLIFSVISYFLCITTKENGITILALIPLILYFFTNTAIKKIIVLSSPYFAIVVIFLLIRNVVLDPYVEQENIHYILNNSLLGAKNVSEMLATNFIILGKYIKLLLIPYPLSWDYSYNQIPITNWTDIKAIISLFVYMALAVYCVIKIKKKDIFTFSILFFFITLSVSSNLFIKIGATFGERFLFIPSLGFCIVIVMLLFKALKIKIDGVLKNKNYLYGITITILIIYSVITINRNKDWENGYALYLSGAEICPNSARTHYQLGNAYREMGEVEKDFQVKNKLFNNAISSYNRSINIYSKYTVSYYNLGVTYYEIGDIDNALKAYKNAIDIEPNLDALNNIGVIYFEKKDFDSALKYWLKILEIDKNNSKAISNVGAVYHNKQDYKNAIIYYEKAISINPYDINVYNNLVKVYNSLGNINKANYYYQKANQLK